VGGGKDDRDGHTNLWGDRVGHREKRLEGTSQGGTKLSVRGKEGGHRGGNGYLMPIVEGFQ